MASPPIVQNEKVLTFQLKGGLYPLTALQILSDQLALFEQQLISKISQAPKFFKNAPVVIDLQKLPPSDAEFKFKNLIEILSKHHLIPVGIKGGTPAQQSAASLAGLPILQNSGKDPVKPVKAESEAAHSPLPQAALPPTTKQKPVEPTDDLRGTNSRVITEPVRYGQQIYVRGGDLIVLAPVSQGSELLADGHIHIYGPLRGRALAGVTGDQQARIFCQSLEAELISIAGQYKISEDIDRAAWSSPVNIFIEGGRLHIKAF